MPIDTVGITQSRFRPPSALLLLISFCCAAFAQTVDTGRISGVVHDASGALVPGALVTIQNRSTKLSQKLVSDDAALFVTPPLPPADYEVTVAAPGFAQLVEHVHLEVSQRVSLELSLQPGDISQSVTVQASPADLGTDTSTLSNLRTERAVQNLPMNGRNFAELMGLAAGVVPAQSQLSGAAPLTQARGETGYSVNGLRMEDNSFLLDGISDNENHNGLGVILFPPMDAVQEFREETSVPDARFGRGGGTVNLVFKSGTGQYHGDLFEYLRNSDLDARNFFDSTKPAFRMNQFGGTLGGPLWPQHDPKTFFFVDYEGQRIAQALTFVTTVPTLAERSGNFSAAKQTIYNPLTTVQNPDGTYSRTAFANNTIPSNLISTVGQNLIDLYPLPNLPGLANNYLYQPIHTVDSNSFDIKLDHRFTDKDSAFVRYSQSLSDLFQPGNLPAPAVGGTISGPSTQPAHQAVIDEEHIFSPTTVNSFRAGWSRINIDAQGLGNDTALADQLGIPGSNVAGDALTYGLPLISVTGAGSLGSGSNLPAIIITNNYQANDSLSIVKGRHTLQIGVGVLRQQYNVFQTLNERGTLSFTTAYSSDPAPSCATSKSAYCVNVPASGNGIGLADLLLGVPLTGSLATVDGMRGLRRTDLSSFLQDDWKVTEKLTVNLGLRYENYLGWPWTEVGNRAYNFIPSTASLVQVGTNGVPQSGVHGNNLDFMPRAGFAYQLFSHTVIRSAYGIFYNDPQVIFGNSIENNPPEAISYSFTNSQYNFAAAQPASAGFERTTNPFAGTLYAVQENAKTPYAQQWNFTIQQQLDPSTILTVAYVGTKGTHLQGAENLNQPVPGIAPVATRRPYPLYQTITYLFNDDNSSYNGLQVIAEHRLAHNIAFQASYTWSHALDDASFNPSGGSSTFEDTYNHALDYANADFDVRQRLTASFTYDLPFKLNGRWGLLVNGWQTNGILTLSTGIPFSVQSASNTLNNGATSRASYVPGEGNGELSSGARSVTEWFNVAAFTQPGAQQYGDVARNSLYGPATRELDFSLFKNFAFGSEGVRKLQLRAEAFNVANTPQFNNPVNTIGAAGAGSITSAGSPFTFQRLSREVQLAAKFYF